jgi:hypothetical protein
VRLPLRFCTPRGVRLAVARALRRRGVRENARSIARWAAAHDGAVEATRQLERWWAARASGRPPA